MQPGDPAAAAAGPLTGPLAAALRGLVVRSDADIDARELADRKAAAGAILGRLPDYVRMPLPAVLLARVEGGPFRSAATAWRPELGSLLLLGPTGAGKSSAAGYAFRRELGRGVKHGGETWARAQRMRWFAATELETARKEHPLGKGEAPELLLASRAPLVVIDDAGWDKDPTAVRTVLASRYEGSLTTIITSNLGASGLVAHYGSAAVRKMCEAGGPRVMLVEAA